MANDVFEVVRTVLAIREYQDKDVPADVVSRVVESARLTASSMNRQPLTEVASAEHFGTPFS